MLCVLFEFSRDLDEKVLRNFCFRGTCKPAGDKLVKIWSPHTGQLIKNLMGHSKGLSDVAWSSDSVFLASASDDTTIRIWTVDTVCLVYPPVLILDRLISWCNRD